jgi:nitrogen fixation protein FixH
MKKLYIILFTLLSLTALAQSPYNNNVYSSAIKTVEFYNTAKQGSFPVINLGSDEKVLLAFDDLRGGSRNYSYTIEHCDANWNSSNLSPAEYLQSFTDDRLYNYSYSTGTMQKYTHYEISLPNNNIAPKISGNYVLKVYEDGDQNKMVLTRRLYVLGKRVAIAANLVASANNATRQTNQKINFTVDYSGLVVQNPAYALRTFIMQNARTETAVLNGQPTYIRGSQLIYNDISINDFPGRNEFRLFDTRTLKLNSQRVAKIYKDSTNVVVLLGDPVRDQPNYIFQYDNDGKFYILNNDGTTPATDADYAHVYFTLTTGKNTKDGSPYVVGQFNNYRLDESNKLHPLDNGRYTVNMLLKQGVYDYEYVWVDAKTGKADDIPFEGSYFETENEYQMLTYYRPPAARWDELVGFRELLTKR